MTYYKLPLTLGRRWLFWGCVITLLVLSAAVQTAYAHGVALGDKGYIQESSGVLLLPFIYLGAKHMMTGYDHLLFLFAVVFFLYHLKDVAIYVTLFAVGHSVTLLTGVLQSIAIDAYIIDTIIGFSAVYKALDNLGAFRRWFGVQPDTRVATFAFGLMHGFGLAAKIQDFEIAQDGLIPNLLAFNVGVEIGQLLALSAVLLLLSFWRLSPSFERNAYRANVVMMSLGFLLMGYQISGYLLSNNII